MTLLISDGKTVIADSIEMIQDLCDVAESPKIRGFKDKVCGVAGVLAYREVLFEWADKHSCDPEHFPKHITDTNWVLVVFKEDAAYYYTNDLMYPDKYPYPCAFGGGAVYTQIAMRCGVPIKKIAETCCESLANVSLPLCQIKIPIKKKETINE